MLSVHAALAIEKANLYERSRELSIVEERNRLARELHDSVTQKLFGLTLTAEAAATVIDRDPDEAKAQLRRLQELTREAMEELRSLIFELRPPEAESEGLATALRKHVDVLQSVHGDAVALSVEGDAEPRGGAAEVLRIAQEALQNALRHADASRVDVRAARDDGHLQRRGRRRRRRLRPRRARAALAPARPDLDGGARPRARRHAEHRLAPRRRHHHRARGAAVIRVLIADDHAVVREGLRAFLALQDDVEVVGEAADGEEAVQAVVRLEPDVALVDLVMPRVDGIEAIGRIRAERPETRVIVLTSFVDEDKMLPAVRAGAVGYLLKDVAAAGARQRDPHRARRRHAAAPDGGRGARARGLARRRGAGARPTRSPRASARCWPSSPAAGPTRRSPSSSAWPRRRSRPTSATSWASSGSATARRRRCTRCARASSTPEPLTRRS